MAPIQALDSVRRICARFQDALETRVCLHPGNFGVSRSELIPLVSFGHTALVRRRTNPTLGLDHVKQKGERMEYGWLSQAYCRAEDVLVKLETTCCESQAVRRRQEEGVDGMLPGRAPRQSRQEAR
jgi:hypothetical protein